MKKGKCFSMANQGQRKKSDFYQTPYSLTQHLLDVEKFEGTILEPAYGEGAIFKVLEDYNYPYITGTDISLGNNFLETFQPYDNIITNPPYSLANEFILKAKEIYSKKIAMLLPLSYLHGQKRYKLGIHKQLKKVYVFTRYPMLSDTIREDGKYNTGMMVYAWYIWNKAWQGNPTIYWIDNNADVLKNGE